MLGNHRIVRRAALLTSIPIASAVPAAGPLAAAPAFASVSSTPAYNTPQLATTSTTEQVRQLVQCGSTMYAVGTFTSISWKGTRYSRNSIFSFSATAPYTVTSWNPDVNGIVNTIAFDGSHCDTAYIGGKFSSVHGTAANNIAAISTSTGAVDTKFEHSANGQVETIASAFGHLLVGGFYTTINNDSSGPYMTSLNPSTGASDGFLHLKISGSIQFPGVHPNATRVYNQQISHGGTLDLVEGDFSSVGGVARQQIFMLNIGGSTATVTAWSSPSFMQNCWYGEPFYIRAASWSPDDSTVYIGDTGYKPYNWNGKFPWTTSLCDAAAAFPATQASVNPLWINFTGCDSLYSTAADSTTAYFGGHERWSENPYGCDDAGTGAISAPGMEGLSPSNGALTFNPTRARGLGADDMLLTGAGLWIASDNYEDSNMCGGVYGHAGICFMPYG